MYGLHVRFGTFIRSFGGFAVFIAGSLVVLGGTLSTSRVVSQGSPLFFFMDATTGSTTIDRGVRSGGRVATRSRSLALGETPSGGGRGGLFGPVIPWPIIPIHMSLLPDGRVLSYGTDQDGIRGRELVYDIWDPKLGTGPESHKTLDNTTSTDVFCSAASLIAPGLGSNPSFAGKTMILGGDLTIDGVRGYSNNRITVFDPASDKLGSDSKTFRYARWYPTITTMPNGSKLLIGGRIEPGKAAEVPELYRPTSGWTQLPGIRISDTNEWFYPRAIVGRDGAVYVIQNNTKILRLVIGGAGRMYDTGVRTYPSSAAWPAVPMSNATPFSVLAVRGDRVVQIVDLANYPPVVKNVERINKDRVWGNLTLLPDGRILATGGSAVNNELTDVAYQSEVFDPLSGHWTFGASASVPRLYHSSALLLPDGSVLTGGGGAPGPYANLNAEIYYPSYLFDPEGNPAPRPTIVNAPTKLVPGKTFQLSVGPSDIVGRVSLSRLGANTHDYDGEQRLQPVPFYQSGRKIVGYVTPNPRLLPPGYYMIFVFDKAGVPAVARIVSVPQVVE